MKTNIKVFIQNNEEKLSFKYPAIYIKNKNIIKYQEKDKTNVTLDTKNNILIRENNNIYMEYIFKKNKISNNKLIIKDLNKELKLKLKTHEIINKDKLYKVKYEIIENNENFVYEVVMEV